MKTLEDELARIEDKIFSAFSKKVGVSSINVFESKRLTELQKINEEKTKITNEFHRLQQQLEFEINRDFKTQIEKLKNLLKENEKKLLELKNSENKLTDEIDKDKQHLDELLVESKKIQQDLEQRQSIIKTLKKQVTESENIVSNINSKLSLHHSQFRTLLLSKHEIIRSAKVEDIQLPIEETVDIQGRKKKKQRKSEGDDEKIEEEVQREIAADTEIVGELAQDIDTKELAYEQSLRFNFDEVNEELLESLDIAQREAKRIELTEALNEVKQDAEKLAPNLKAADKYDAVNG